MNARLAESTIEAIIDGENVCPFPEVLSFRLDRPGIGNVVMQAVKKTERFGQCDLMKKLSELSNGGWQATLPDDITMRPK